MALYDDIQNKVKVQPKKTSSAETTTTVNTANATPIVKVGRTTTGTPGTPANVSVTGTNTLNFTIPEGIPGVSGEPGPAGVGINILGELDSTAELPETAFQGDAYTIDGDLWIWTDDEGGAWNNAGAFRGPAGPPGANGAAGPAGANGANGADGPPGSAATVSVGNTTTGTAGSNAAVTNSGNSSAAVFNFTIPRGQDGAAATISVGTVTTGAAGSNATITNAGNSSAAVFNFTIPRGDTGATGNSATAVWGGISGNIATQSDLMAQFAGMVNLANAQLITGTKTFGGAVGTEGGEFHIQKPVTGGALTGDLAFDIAGNSLRIFDSGGTNKGITLDLSTLAPGVASAFWHSGSPKFTADFTSGAGVRAHFQTLTADSPTNVTVIPSGTGTQALFSAFNGSNWANAAAIQVGVDSTTAYIQNARSGTAAALPLALRFESTPVVTLTSNTQVNIVNNATIKFNNAIRQHITLWETSTTPGSESSYGLGVQNSTAYWRSDAAFALFYKGTHHADQFNPGSNGILVAKFDRVAQTSQINTTLLQLGTAQGMARIEGNDTGHQIILRATVSGTYPSLTYTAADATTFFEFGNQWAWRNQTTNKMLLTGAGLYLYDNGWFRTQSSGVGWYHEVHAGGWYMEDNSWIKNYNGKALRIVSSVDTVTRFESGAPTMEFYDTNEGYTSWIHLNSGQHGFLQHNAFAWAAYRTSGNEWHCVGNIVAYASDRRLKKNIIDVPQDRVTYFFDNVRIRQFDWDAVAMKKHKIGFQVELNQVGAIAQEMQEAFPDAVAVNGAHNPVHEKNGKPDFLTIQWEKTVPLIIAEVQRLRARVAELENNT